MSSMREPIRTRPRASTVPPSAAPSSAPGLNIGDGGGGGGGGGGSNRKPSTADAVLAMAEVLKSEGRAQREHEQEMINQCKQQ